MGMAKRTAARTVGWDSVAPDGYRRIVADLKLPNNEALLRSVSLWSREARVRYSLNRWFTGVLPDFPRLYQIGDRGSGEHAPV